ncbi:alpha/beta hydrolase [Embleya scabrispora]|uniref:alpha/beta hydrolase n=1 Tax=Embleya scabrispora TaxID=159449 RepID=UPI00035F8497|nr:alpha/beta hydrolase [Embleya scabrispora]MYS87194.1 alpha/beta fold hydrolase [Streptomyces sp. SID5474]
MTRAVRVLLAGALTAAVLTAAGPVRADTEPIVWGDCPPGTATGERCGTVGVPLDHTRADGPRIRVGVSKVAATGTKAEYQGILMVNFGGPGAAGVGSMAALAGGLPERLRRAYDLIGFDLRGRGTSTRVECTDPQTFGRAPKPDPASPGSRATHLAAARAFADGCRASAGDLLPHLTTRDIARDLDLVRAAFGADRLSVLGYSYGSYLGAVYGQLFPNRVHRMLLDSLVDPTEVWYGTGFLQARGFDVRRHDWAAWTADRADRFHLGETTTTVLATWDRLRVELAAHPAGGVFGGVELDQYTLGKLYTDRDWARLSGALADYASGDPAALIAGRKPATRDEVNFESVMQTVTCADAPYPADEAVFERDMAVLRGRYGALGATIASPGACLYLQSNTAPPTRIDGAGLPGVLLVQSVGDPATPYEGALRMHAALPTSRLLTVRGNGNHGHYLVEGPCVDDRGTAYLVDGVLPATDIECTGPAPTDPDPRRSTIVHPRR